MAQQSLALGDGLWLLESDGISIDKDTRQIIGIHEVHRPTMTQCSNCLRTVCQSQVHSRSACEDFCTPGCEADFAKRSV